MREEGLTCDFRVGEEWLVQPRLNRITGRGKVAQLQPKIMGVLCVLAERAGEVVSRERLFGTVWAETHVTEHVLARSISELRKALGDTPKDSRVIETIPKAGYRLIAPVSKIQDADPSRGAGPEEKTARRGISLPPWLAVGALSLSVGFMLLALYLIFFVRHVHFFHFRHH